METEPHSHQEHRADHGHNQAQPNRPPIVIYRVPDHVPPVRRWLRIWLPCDGPALPNTRGHGATPGRPEEGTSLPDRWGRTSPRSVCTAPWLEPGCPQCTAAVDETCRTEIATTFATLLCRCIALIGGTRRPGAVRPSFELPGLSAFEFPAFVARCGAGRREVSVPTDLDAERDETPDSRLDAEPASLALESVEAEADNGEDDNARKYSQHNGTLQLPHRAPMMYPLADWLRSMSVTTWTFSSGAVGLLVCRCGCLYCASRAVSVADVLTTGRFGRRCWRFYTQQRPAPACQHPWRLDVGCSLGPGPRRQAQG